MKTIFSILVISSINLAGILAPQPDFHLELGLSNSGNRTDHIKADKDQNTPHDLQDASYSIFNLLGEEIFQGDEFALVHEDFSNQQEGIYFLEEKEVDGTIRVEKLIFD